MLSRNCDRNLRQRHWVYFGSVPKSPFMIRSYEAESLDMSREGICARRQCPMAPYILKGKTGEPYTRPSRRRAKYDKSEIHCLATFTLREFKEDVPSSFQMSGAHFFRECAHCAWNQRSLSVIMGVLPPFGGTFGLAPFCGASLICLAAEVHPRLPPIVCVLSSKTQWPKRAI